MDLLIMHHQKIAFISIYFQMSLVDFIALINLIINLNFYLILNYLLI